MTIDEFDKYLNDKMNNGGRRLIFTYFEFRVKCNFSKEETSIAINLAKRKLESNRYTTYVAGNKYYFEKREYIVKENELLVAIRE